MSADPFAGMADHELLVRAAGHLRTAAAFGLGSVQGSKAQIAFHTVMSEFNRRELARIMKRLPRPS